MRLIGGKTSKQAAGERSSTPDDEYELVADAHSSVRAQIRDLEGFIGEAPRIQQRRKLEAQVTLPPPEDEAASQLLTPVDPSGAEDPGEDTQERYGRRHLEAMRRERRANFYVFLISAALVSAFLYWVSLVVQ